MRNIFSDRRGGVAVVMALSLSVVVAGAAFGVEIGYDHFVQLQMQQAADSAAYGAAVEKRRGSDYSAVVAYATTAATANGYVAATDTIGVETPVAGNPNTVRVTLTRNQPRIFTAFFVPGDLVITVNATATLATAANACILALDPTAASAANFAGNSSTTLNGCVVMSNSISASAVNVQGSAQVWTPCFFSVGGVSVTSGAHLTDCPSAQTSQSPVGDPYASLALPADTGPCLNGNGSNLSPGRYCGGLSLKNTVTFQPGVYIISGGTFSANANANISGSGVTFILTNDASISFNGNAHFNLTAPTTGPYAGFLFVGARTNTSAITLNGDGTSSMTGAIYFANQPVSYLGNFAGTNGCTQIVARTVQWSGSTTVSVDCTAFGIQAIKVGGVALTG